MRPLTLLAQLCSANALGDGLTAMELAAHLAASDTAPPVDVTPVFVAQFVASICDAAVVARAAENGTEPPRARTAAVGSATGDPSAGAAHDEIATFASRFVGAVYDGALTQRAVAIHRGSLACGFVAALVARAMDQPRFIRNDDVLPSLDLIMLSVQLLEGRQPTALANAAFHALRLLGELNRGS